MNPTDDEPGRPLEQEPQILTGADSHNGKDTTSSRRGSDVSYTISTRPPLLPLPPFDQFAKETAPQLDLPDGKELLDRLRDMWDAIEPAERLFWEAQYGRQMLEFTKQKARWEKEHPTPQKAGFKFNLDSIDFGKLAGLWDEFAGKAVAEVFGFGGQEDTVSQVGENYDDSNRDDEVQNENRAPRGRQQNQKRAPRDKLQVLYRAEIYRVRESSRYSSSRRPEAILDRMYEQTSEIDVVPASRLLTAPIFEITTMYDAARGKKDNIISGFRRLMDDDKVPTAEPVKPGDSIQVRVAAGVLLTIGSDIILETIRSVAEHYHDLVWEGDELVVPEPFCVLFHYRDEILARRDQLQSDLQKKRIQYDNGDANLQDRESTESESSDLEDEVPDPALHIDMLYEYVDNRYAKALRQEDERLRKEPPTCTYAWSWRLFKPGELVYTWDDNVLVACVVESHTLKGLWDYDKNTKKPSVKPGRLKKKRNLEFKDELRAVVITVSHMEYDGTYLGRRIRKITIWPFEGEKEIKSLPAFPAKFWDDESVRDQMIERGKRYCSFTKRTHCQYHGLTMSSPRRMVHSRIILDSETYYSEYSPELIPRFHLPPEEIGDQSDDSDSSSSDIPVRRRRRYDEPRYIDTSPYPFTPGSRKSLNVSSYRKRLDSAYHFSRRSDTLSNARIVDPKQSVELSDELYMLCPRQVYGYILKERRWDLLDVEKITPCEFNENIMDDLVLSDEAKRLIQALSSTHAIQKGVISTDTRDEASVRGRWSADFIQNKGDGQIILLHGRPGVGKTSTAECVAEITHRPLIAITCGDLGTTATTVEDNLNDWLRLGTRWEAVLLFDEADVYLESRQQGDFERNTLVSVFLRALEYYQGLLFLTSNRVGSFDEAILSRVHIVLHFPSFNDAEREQIWETSFRKLNEERKDIVLGVGILEYAYGHQDIKSLSWNGREIRNAFNTMVALAEWDARDGKRLTKTGKIELQRKHLQQVVKMSGLFKEYLLRTRGLNESTLAKVQAIRDDEFDPTVN